MAATRTTTKAATSRLKRSNETHESKADRDAKLYRKGKTASELCYMGHTLRDNRRGLVVSAMVTNAGGHVEREGAKVMLRMPGR